MPTNETNRALLVASSSPVIQVIENDESPKAGTPYPISIVALSGAVMTHPWWGRLTFDLTGMTMRGDRIVIDWGHDSECVLGYINKESRVGAQLTVSGALVPMKQEEDKASEIIERMSLGIPYQASIDFTERVDGDWESVYVMEGQTVNANGQTYTGPLTLFTKWPLNAVAIYPHGSDPYTSVKSVPAQLSAKLPKGHPMTKPSTLTPLPDVPANDPQKPAEGQSALTADKPADGTSGSTQLTAAPATAAPATAAPDNPPTQLTSATLAEWSKQFGAENAVTWLTAGKSLPEAYALHSEQVKAQLTAKDQQIAELQTRLTALRPGIAEPTGAAADLANGQGQSQLTPTQQSAAIIAEKMAAAKK